MDLEGGVETYAHELLHLLSLHTRLELSLLSGRKSVGSSALPFGVFFINRATNPSILAVLGAIERRREVLDSSGSFQLSLFQRMEIPKQYEAEI
jgi:hypothetical protein